MTQLKLAALPMLLLYACGSPSTSVGTETGNALAVAGSGTRKSGGVNLQEAVVHIDAVRAVQGADCASARPVHLDGATVDLLGRTELIDLGDAVCGLRLSVRAVRLRGTRAGDPVAVTTPSFTLDFAFERPIEQPFIQFDPATWLDGILPQSGPVTVDAESTIAIQVAENAGTTTTAHDDDGDHRLDGSDDGDLGHPEFSGHDDDAAHGDGADGEGHE